MFENAVYNCTGVTATLMCNGMCMCGVFLLPNSIAVLNSGKGVNHKRS